MGRDIKQNKKGEKIKKGRSKKGERTKKETGGETNSKKNTYICQKKKKGAGIKKIETKTGIGTVCFSVVRKYKD